MSEYSFDVAVLGAGPGGYIAAIRSAQYGKKVVLIESRELGGTCLNRGCIPTKAFLHSAEIYESAKNSENFGITSGEIGYDFVKVAAYKDGIVNKLRTGIAKLEKAHGVKVINGFGRIQDAHTLDVEGERITFDKLIIATGSAPALPPIPGIDCNNVLTSDDVLGMTSLPNSFVIIGGGVIGIEFATVLSAFGKAVTIIEMMPSILPGTDADIVRVLSRVLKKKKVSIINNARVTHISEADTVSVTYEVNGEIKIAEGECCIVCVGRRPLTSDIGLEALGIEMNRSFIKIDEHCRTSADNIYAIGDVTGKIQLAHVASAQGMVAAANACGHTEVMDYSVVPSCIYTSPEIAFVGISEDKAKALGIQYKVGSYNVAGNGKAMIMDEAIGTVKLIGDENGKLIGAQLLCPRATDMISELTALIRLGASIEDVAGTIHPHPTVSEAVMEAAHDYDGMCCHGLPKKHI